MQRKRSFMMRRYMAGFAPKPTFKQRNAKVTVQVQGQDADLIHKTNVSIGAEQVLLLFFHTRSTSSIR